MFIRQVNILYFVAALHWIEENSLVCCRRRPLCAGEWIINAYNFNQLAFHICQKWKTCTRRMYIYKMKQKCESERMRMIWKMLIPIPFIPRVFIINVQVPQTIYLLCICVCVSFWAVWRLHRKKTTHQHNSHCDVTLNLNINVCIHSRSTPLYEVLCIYVKRMRLFVLKNILFLCDWLMIACLVCCVHESVMR